MSNPVTPTRNLTTDIESSEAQIAILDQFSLRKLLKAEEKRGILRVYFTLSREAARKRAKTGRHVYVRARENTTRLFGRGTFTVSAIVFSWIAAVKCGRGTKAKLPIIVCEENRFG